MSETGAAPKKKAFELVTVKIALVLCVIALVALFLPCLHVRDKTLLQLAGIDQQDFSLFNLEKLQVGSGYLIMGIILLVCYVMAATLFLTDHPRLVLLPSIIALYVLFPVLSTISDFTHSRYIVDSTIWPTVQLIADIALIVFASITKKANPKYIKVKVQ